MSNLFVLFGIARFIIWFIQSQHVFDYVFRGNFLAELRKCPICLGFWIFLGLNFIFQFNIFGSEILYLQIVDNIITAAVFSFVLHLIVTGWQTLYGVTVLE